MSVEMCPRHTHTYRRSRRRIDVARYRTRRCDSRCAAGLFTENLETWMGNEIYRHPANRIRPDSPATSPPLGTHGNSPTVRIQLAVYSTDEQRAIGSRRAGERTCCNRRSRPIIVNRRRERLRIWRSRRKRPQVKRSCLVSVQRVRLAQSG
jgi:hypothetical protein